jgi:peptidyl-prolyl cis-trans isomerase D
VLRQINLKIKPNDSAAVVIDRRADSLSSIAAGSDDPKKFDEAATLLGLPIQKAVAFYEQPFMLAGKYVPSVAAWSFSGVEPGESSDLFDNEDGYYLARVDSIVNEGIQPYGDAHDVIKLLLKNKKTLQGLVPLAAKIASRAAASSLETAAKEFNVTVQKAPLFNRIAFAPGLGRDNEAIGASFALPAGSVSTPVVTEDAVFVIRVDKRISAARDEWQKQLVVQRAIQMQSLQQDRIQTYLRRLRESAKIEDRRKELLRSSRNAT